MSVTFSGEHSEIVDLYLVPGNVHCQHQLEDLLLSVTSKHAENLKAGELTFRLV